MLHAVYRKLRWPIMVMVLIGGTVFQASCSTVLTDSAAGLATSIGDAFIRNFISEWLELSSGFSSFM